MYVSRSALLRKEVGIETQHHFVLMVPLCILGSTIQFSPVWMCFFSALKKAWVFQCICICKSASICTSNSHMTPDLPFRMTPEAKHTYQAGELTAVFQML